MNIPMAKNAAAVLKGMYSDRARVERCMTEDGEIKEKVIYTGQRCHLSGKKGLGQGVSSSFRQTEGNGEVKLSYVIYFPPECDIAAGDLITVVRGERSFRGRAGMPVFGGIAIRAALDNVEVT